MNIGTKVKITSLGGFNERFVKIGDIAEVVNITSRESPFDPDYELMCSSWEYRQFTGNYGLGYDFELVK